MLFIAEHPLLPTSPQVGASLERLAKQLAAAGVEVKRETRLLPDLGGLGAALRPSCSTPSCRRDCRTKQHREPDAAEAIPAEDQSFFAELARGVGDEPSRGGSRPISPVRASNTNGAPCFATSTSSSARLPRRPRSHTIRRGRRKRGQSRSGARTSPILINCYGPSSRRPADCRRPSFQSGLRTVCRSASRSLARSSKTGRRSPSPALIERAFGGFIAPPDTHEPDEGLPEP